MLRSNIFCYCRQKYICMISHQGTLNIIKNIFCKTKSIVFLIFLLTNLIILTGIEDFTQGNGGPTKHSAPFIKYVLTRTLQNKAHILFAKV